MTSLKRRIIRIYTKAVFTVYIKLISCTYMYRFVVNCRRLICNIEWKKGGICLTLILSTNQYLKKGINQPQLVFCSY